MMSCLAIKVEGKDEDARTFLIMAFVFPNNHYRCRCPAFQEVPGQQPADGK